MKGVYLQRPLNILSCAVQGRPGRSAYELAVDAGYTGTKAQFSALLFSLPATLSTLQRYNARVDSELENLFQRVAALEAAGPGSHAAGLGSEAPDPEGVEAPDPEGGETP